jgi:hypothetical protein
MMAGKPQSGERYQIVKHVRLGATASAGFELNPVDLCIPAPPTPKSLGMCHASSRWRKPGIFAMF